MKKQSHTTPQAAENQSVTLSSENQSVNSLTYDSTYYCAELGSFISTRAERKKMASRTSAYTATRSSRPVKEQSTTTEVAMHFAAKDMEQDFARVFYFGRKSDFVASAEPRDRKNTVVMINGIPHKKGGTGGYKALTLQATDEQGVTEMYQYLLLLAESGPMAAADYVILLQEAGF